MNTSPLIESIVAEFEGKFVVDEASVEFKDDGKMGWADDTRLMADYVDGRTLTAKMITDFLREKLTHIRTLSIAEGERIGRKKITQVIKDFPVPSVGEDGGAWRDAFIGFKTLLVRDLEQASHPSYE